MSENVLIAKFFLWLHVVVPKILAWVGSILPAIIGSAISLKLSRENMTPFERITMFMFGAFLASFAGGATVDIFLVDRNTMIDESIILAWGIFGMAIAEQFWKQVPILTNEISDLIIRIIRNKSGK